MERAADCLTNFYLEPFDKSHARPYHGPVMRSPEQDTPLPQPETDVPVGRRLYLETFGCQMNVLDSQLVSGALRGLGYRFVDDWRQADVVLYNTCSVREHAEQKVYSRLGQLGPYKKEHRPDLVIGVIGCMAEREGLDMVARHPYIDLLCGPGELDKAPMLIDNVVKTGLSRRGGKRFAQTALQGDNHRRSATLAAAEDQLELLDLARSFSPDEFHGSAYVRITRGCNKFCTYCVVPNTRGREVHRAPQAIVQECQRLVDAGVVEITLLGQTVNHYHYDEGAAVRVDGVWRPQIGGAVRNNKDHQFKAGGLQNDAATDGITTFADLLRRIHEQVPTLQRLRFVTNFPRDFGNDILEAIRDCPRICRYLHLPVQSGSDRILQLMNRDYTVAQYRDLLERVRAYLPDSEIATDIICGFPTETEQDHQATLDLLRWGGFKNSYIFKYSPRPGTTANDRLPDDVSNDVKKRRNHELLTVQTEISRAVHQAYQGKTVRVFVESISARSQKNANAADPSVTLGWRAPIETTQLSGRTDGDLIVLFDADVSLIGSIVDVQIERAGPLTLFGSLARQPAAAT